MAIIGQGCPHCKALLGVHVKNPTGYLIPIRCKRWSCRYCRRLNLKMLLDRIRRGNPTKMLTLTAVRYWPETVENCYERHRPQIRRLIQFCRENYGHVEYFCVTEFTKKGNPHWHLVMKAPFLPFFSLKREWERLTGSKIIWIDKIENQQHCANYVAKYVIKNCGEDRPTWLKRICQFSRKYASKRKFFLPEDHTWHLLKTSYQEAIDALDTAQHHLEDDPLGKRIYPYHPDLNDDPREAFSAEQFTRPP